MKFVSQQLLWLVLEILEVAKIASQEKDVCAL